MSFTIYFRDCDECLRSMIHRAASESEARDWFARIGIAIVAIRPELA